MEKTTLSIEVGAEHAKQLLERLGIQKAHILAFSFGGVIGFQFLLSYPERTRSAILLEPYLSREAPDVVQANIDAFRWLDVHGRLAAISSWGFRMSQADIQGTREANYAGVAAMPWFRETRSSRGEGPSPREISITSHRL